MQVEINNEVQKLEVEANGIMTQAKTYSIKTTQDYEAVGGELMRIKGFRKQIDSIFDPVVSAAHAAHKEAVASKKKLTDPLDMAERSFKLAMSAYQQEQDRIARVEQERLRKIAEENARKERERLEAQAIKAIEKGQDEKAEALLEKSEQVVAFTPIVQAETVKVAGISSRKVWKANIIDPAKVPAYISGVEIREISLGRVERYINMTGGTQQIPGIEMYEETIMSARAR